MYPLIPPSPATFAELLMFFLLLIFVTMEGKNREWEAWKRAAVEKEAEEDESHQRELTLSHRKTCTARLRADGAESALRSTKLSFDLERAAEWEEEKRKLVGDLEKVRRVNKGIVYLRAKIASAEAGMRFWEKAYRRKD
ncbi:hypothetical protein ONZ45_g12783 [Pleurotus djamor]|nr:hypothetical protein ONZ45_g12783 [Pleurotus djamor]